MKWDGQTIEKVRVRANVNEVEQVEANIHIPSSNLILTSTSKWLEDCEIQLPAEHVALFLGTLNRLEISNTDDYTTPTPMLDGMGYEVSIVAGKRFFARSYFCPEDSGDKRLIAIAKVIGDFIAELYPERWKTQNRVQANEQHQMFLDRQSKAKQQLASRKKLAEQMRQQLVRDGLRCAKCGVITKQMRYCDGEAFFICGECGCSNLDFEEMLS